MEIFESIKENLLVVIIFWSIFLFSIFLAKIYQKKRVVINIDGKRIVKKIDGITNFLWILIIIIGPSLIFGLRNYYVGADTLNYVNSYLSIGYYNSTIEHFKLFGMDRALFWLFRHIIYYISNGNPTIFLWSMAILTLFILFKAMEKWIDKYPLPIMLFVYYCIFGMQLMNQSRQMLALSIFFYSLYYLFEDNDKKYLVCILLAGLVHYTAFIGILIYFLKFKKNKYFKIKQRSIYLIALISPIIIPIIIPIIYNILPQTYKVYLENINKSTIGLGLLLNTLPIIIPIILYKKYLKCDFGQYLIRIASLAVIFRIAGYYSYFLMRMYYYGAISIVLIVGLITSKFKIRDSKLIANVNFFILFIMYYILNYMYAYKEVFFPYYTIF